MKFLMFVFMIAISVSNSFGQDLRIYVDENRSSPAETIQIKGDEGVLSPVEDGTLGTSRFVHVDVYEGESLVEIVLADATNDESGGAQLIEVTVEHDYTVGSLKNISARKLFPDGSLDANSTIKAGSTFYYNPHILGNLEIQLTPVNPNAGQKKIPLRLCAHGTEGGGT